MKRHPILIPISREHHQVLLLAQLIKKNAPAYRGLPETLEGKIQYVRQFYRSLLSNHLSRDRHILFEYLEKWDELSELCQELTEQNLNLQKQLEEISNNVSADKMDEIGNSLEHYVRMKERSLFQQTQQLLTEADFTELKDKLQF